MGIKDLDKPQRPSIDTVLAALDEPVRGVLRKALTTRKNGGTSRVFEVSAPEIQRACAEDGYAITRRDIDEWRRRNVD